MYGVDLSEYQGFPDYKKMKEDGIKFVILRLIKQNGSMDKSFYYNLEQAKKHGIAVGAYIYSYDLSYEDSAERAQKGVDALKGAYLELPFFIDLEYGKQKNNSEMKSIINGFKNVVEKAGYRFGIYCNMDWKKNVPAISCFDVPLWIARYGGNDGRLKEKYRPNVGECIWQYTSVAHVGGISVRCDKNHMNKNIIQWEKKEEVKEELPNLSGFVGVSITSALESKGYQSSFEYRKKLAEKVGIKNYTGTATQNMDLIEKLGGSIKQEVPSLKGYKGFSIVQGLQKFGYKSDFNYRGELWKKVGKTSKYKGTSLQNLTLLTILKSR